MSRPKVKELVSAFVVAMQSRGSYSTMFLLEEAQYWIWGNSGRWVGETALTKYLKELGVTRPYPRGYWYINGSDKISCPFCGLLLTKRKIEAQ